ncbi:response regulator receiver domain protein [Veillonellaceae bacterium DNF00626]|nr:response regulator receiver domain protein [Veillonellaceae bacterium DNF00626]
MGGKGMKKKYKIVIADDEMIICMDLKEILEEAGHEVIGMAADGVEALKLVKEKKPDVAILDIQMPEIDGLQVAKLIAHDHIAPVVLLTAFGEEETIEKAKKSDVFGYVVKPAEERTLLPAIEIAVSQFQTKNEIVNKVKNMERELAARKVIERAKGLLMINYGLTEEIAYKKMQQISMKRGKPIEIIAEKIVKEILLKQNNT